MLPSIGDIKKKMKAFYVLFAFVLQCRGCKQAHAKHALVDV